MMGALGDRGEKKKKVACVQVDGVVVLLLPDNSLNNLTRCES